MRLRSVWTSEKKNSGYFFIQRLLTGFMTEAECVYSAVRAESLNAIQVNLTYKRNITAFKQTGF